MNFIDETQELAAPVVEERSSLDPGREQIQATCKETIKVLLLRFRNFRDKKYLHCDESSIEQARSLKNEVDALVQKLVYGDWRKIFELIDGSTRCETHLRLDYKPDQRGKLHSLQELSLAQEVLTQLVESGVVKRSPSAAVACVKNLYASEHPRPGSEEGEKAFKAWLHESGVFLVAGMRDPATIIKACRRVYDFWQQDADTMIQYRDLFQKFFSEKVEPALAQTFAKIKALVSESVEVPGFIKDMLQISGAKLTMLELAKAIYRAKPELANQVMELLSTGHPEIEILTKIQELKSWSDFTRTLTVKYPEELRDVAAKLGYKRMPYAYTEKADWMDLGFRSDMFWDWQSWERL
ncbi:MAG: hypothetical protein PHU71_03140 [Candidatus Gracilibacteria bacterium]|nr:hypothetical protein [Candidatus Gracilibacteria bacterium]